MEFRDQLNRTIILKKYPQRIVSIVPSQTELLFDLKLNEKVVGITKFCIHPACWHTTKTRIGGTKNVNINKIIELKPDLIIANKEENTKADIETLEKIAPIYISDIKTLDDALQMIRDIGKITNKVSKAKTIETYINIQFEDIDYVRSLEMGIYKTTCCYLIWNNPYMTVGRDTFIHDMLAKCWFKNVFSIKRRYPVITIDDIVKANPAVIFLSSEPYPFKQKHITELKQFLPNSKIMLVDGEMFSWYGSRLIKSGMYFKSLYAAIKT